MPLKIDRFVPAIVLVVVLAYLIPEGGSGRPKAVLETISSIGVSLIFLFYGLKLSPDEISSGLKNWKLHLLIQATTFLLFPLLVIGFYPLAQSSNAEEIWLSFLFLGALPSTVSSSVVMVSLARGNVSAAIFNASISGLIGILVTPLWMGMFLENITADFDLGQVYVKLLTEILVPVILGLFLRNWFARFALRHSFYLTMFDKAVILLIIYKSFAESFENKIFESVSLIDFAWIGISVFALFWLVYLLTGFMADRFRFNREDRITAQFCGTKKSLVHGTVFSKILFPESVSAGIVLLPLMLFHAAQIFIISIIATRKSKEGNP